MATVCFCSCDNVNGNLVFFKFILNCSYRLSNSRTVRCGVMKIIMQTTLYHRLYLYNGLTTLATGFINWIAVRWRSAECCVFIAYRPTY